MKLLFISAGWLVACVLAIRWALPRLKASEKELDHDQVIDRTLPWGTIFPRDPMKYDGRDLPPVPPILNQSERWQERARRAEALGFMDEEAPTPPRAA